MSKFLPHFSYPATDNMYPVLQPSENTMTVLAEFRKLNVLLHRPIPPVMARDPPVACKVAMITMIGARVQSALGKPLVELLCWRVRLILFSKPVNSYRSYYHLQK